MANNAVDAMANRELADVPSRVVPLSEHDELEIANGYPDVRGWDVRDFTGRSVGYVYDLLVDEIRVWYLDVLLDPEFAGEGADPRVLIPVERAGLDGSSESVLLRGMDAAEIRALVPYAHRGLSTERDEMRPRSAEEPVIDKPQVQPTEVENRNTVKSGSAPTTVPTVRENVEVERPGAVAATAQMRSDQTSRRHLRSPARVDSASRTQHVAAPTVGRRHDRMNTMANDRWDIRVQRRDGNGGARQQTDARGSIGELFKRLTGDATHLIQQEVALAKIELREAGARLTRDATRIGIAVGLALPGLFALTAFLVLGLGDLIDNYWLAALIVGALFVAIGGVLTGNAVSDIRRRGLTPEATMETVREDTAWAKREMREFKQNVRS
jgi:uncharacterized membrane protein YqjE